MSSKDKHWKLSEKTKKKMSEIRSEINKKLGIKPPSFKGKHHSIETKKKMSQAKKGKRCSEETRRKMSEAFKGRHYSEETRKRMSEAKKKLGLIPPSRKGKHMSEEAKEKISKASKGRVGWCRGIKGSKTPNWKGGITPIKKQIKNSEKYKEWRQQIFLRDNFICQRCKEKGGYLHAHHKNKFFSRLLEEVKLNLPLLPLYEGAMIYTPLWDIDNGITLCKKCHMGLHKKTKGGGNS